ncbi:MAG: Arm DNA-binding domain-containing protein [Deltaproteobacteria bacterium]|jgi:hypothetical protein|nr:Arm DNA-binding domain-containing protein [Deltaproteobacteria bacterium]
MHCGKDCGQADGEGDTAVRPGPKARKLSDGHGLYLWVHPRGSMSRRYACSFQGKEKTLSIGTWPEVSLAEARTAPAEARRLLASGVSPADAKREAKFAAPQADSPTFGRLAEDCLARIAGDHAESTVAAVSCVLATRVLPSLGDRRADGIRRMVAMAALAPLEAEGKLSTWRKARGIIGRVFRHGMARGHELMDPTSGLQGAVAAPRTVPGAVDPLSGTTRLPRVAVLATILGWAGACCHAKTVGASVIIDGHVKER